MKKHFLLLLLIPFFAGCDMLSELTKIDLPLSQSITIPQATPKNVETVITTPDVETGIESILASYNVTTDLIQSVSFKEMKLTSTTGDMTFLKNLEIWISAEGLDDKKIAWVTDVPETTGTSITLTVSNDDLQTFILKDKFKLKFKTTTDKDLTANQDITIDMKFTIDLKVLGL